MNDNKKIAINSIVIFLRLCIVSIIGLITSRWVLQALGASDFGLYNVVGGIVVLLNIMGSSMSSSTFRFLAFEIGKRGEGNPRKVFNISLSIHVCFAILILVLGASLGLWYVNNYLNVEPERIGVARFVLFISILTAAINAIKIPCDGLLIAYEKFQVAAITDIFTHIIKLCLFYYLLHYGGDRLRLYSILMLIISVVGWLIVVGYTVLRHWDVVKPHLYRDWKLIREMLVFSMWILYGALAGMGRKQGTNMLINFFFGTLVNAAYAIATQIETYILMFARTLNNAAIPQITKNISGGNSSRSINLASYISKYTYFMMLLVAFPLVVEIDFVLDIWLADVPNGASVFCQLIVVSGLIGCLGEGIPPLVQATGKLKQFTRVTSTITLMGLPIGWILYRMGFPPSSMLIGYIALDLVVAISRLVLLKKILDFDVRGFIKTSYFRILYVSLPLIIVFLLYKPSRLPFWGHILGLIGAVLCVLVFILLFGIDNKEKKMLRQVISNIKQKLWIVRK